MICTAHAYKHTHKHTYSEKTEEDLLFFYGSDGRVLPNHVRGTGIKTQLSLFFFFLLLMLEPFFLSSENDAKNRFFKKQTIRRHRSYGTDA